jgi:hypothetical protein
MAKVVITITDGPDLRDGERGTIEMGIESDPEFPFDVDVVVTPAQSIAWHAFMTARKLIEEHFDGQISVASIDGKPVMEEQDAD